MKSKINTIEDLEVFACKLVDQIYDLPENLLLGVLVSNDFVSQVTTGLSMDAKFGLKYNSQAGPTFIIVTEEQVPTHITNDQHSVSVPTIQDKKDISADMFFAGVDGHPPAGTTSLSKNMSGFLVKFKSNDLTFKEMNRGSDTAPAIVVADNEDGSVNLKVFVNNSAADLFIENVFNQNERKDFQYWTW